MKKKHTFMSVMGVIFILLILIGGVVALYFATGGMKDWDPSNWGDNITDKLPGATQTVTLKSEKYGTYEVERGEIFKSFSNRSDPNKFNMFGVRNGTDLSVLYDFIHNETNFDSFQKEATYPVFTMDISFVTDIVDTDFDSYTDQKGAFYYKVNEDDKVLRFDESKLARLVKRLTKLYITLIDIKNGAKKGVKSGPFWTFFRLKK